MLTDSGWPGESSCSLRRPRIVNRAMTVRPPSGVALRPLVFGGWTAERTKATPSKRSSVVTRQRCAASAVTSNIGSFDRSGSSGPYCWFQSNSAPG